MMPASYSQLREVWADNFAHEFSLLRDLSEKYSCICIVAEFPGITARPIGLFSSTTQYHYQTLRCNVDHLSVVQLGVSLASPDGERPSELIGFQFNFRFVVSEENVSTEYIAQLAQRGVDVTKHEVYGIPLQTFAEQLNGSGLLLTPRIRWVSYQAGFDFAFLLRIITNLSLPSNELSFLALLHKFFPRLLDLRTLVRPPNGSKSLFTDLREICTTLDIGFRPEPPPLAVYDAALALNLLHYLQRRVYGGKLDDVQFNGHIYGLPVLPSVSAENVNSNPHHGRSVTLNLTQQSPYVSQEGYNSGISTSMGYTQSNVAPGASSYHSNYVANRASNGVYMSNNHQLNHIQQNNNFAQLPPNAIISSQNHNPTFVSPTRSEDVTIYRGGANNAYVHHNVHSSTSQKAVPIAVRSTSSSPGTSLSISTSGQNMWNNSHHGGGVPAVKIATSMNASNGVFLNRSSNVNPAALNASGATPDFSKLETALANSGININISTTSTSAAAGTNSRRSRSHTRNANTATAGASTSGNSNVASVLLTANSNRSINGGISSSTNGNNFVNGGVHGVQLKK